jgi:hypothetical protein
MGLPKKWACIAIGDGGYVSVSDIEDEDILEANIAMSNDDSTDVKALGTVAKWHYYAVNFECHGGVV